MALKTTEEYLESIRRLNLPVYVMGERVKNVDHPIIRPSIRFREVSRMKSAGPHV